MTWLSRRELYSSGQSLLGVLPSSKQHSDMLKALSYSWGNRLGEVPGSE